MFAPPPEIETEVFARLPDGFRLSERPAPWLEAQLRGAPMHSLLEGPAFDRAGNGDLYVTGAESGSVLRARLLVAGRAPFSHS